MYYNPTLHNINHLHLKKDVGTQSTLALHTHSMNWIYYTKSLNISIRNFTPQYTIVQINAIDPLYQLSFINAMKHQLIPVRNQISNLYTYTLFNLISVNAHVEFFFHVTLSIKILTTRKFRRNFSSTFQVLVFNTLFVLVTPLQSLPTKQEAHRSP